MAWVKWWLRRLLSVGATILAGLYSLFVVLVLISLIDWALGWPGVLVWVVLPSLLMLYVAVSE